MVATSRESLDVVGERVCPVDPLGVPPAAASLEQIESSEAGALFLARLPMNVDGPPVERRREVAAVGTICRSLDGMPLGLELAAARSRTLSLPELADRLEHSISELALPGHGVSRSPPHDAGRARLGLRLLSRSGTAGAAGDERVRRWLRAVGVRRRVPRRRRIRRGRACIDELVRTSFVIVDATSDADPLPAARTRPPVRGGAAGGRRRSGRSATTAPAVLWRPGEDAGRTSTASGKAPLEALLRELGNLRAALDWAQDADETEAGLCLAADMESVWASEAHHAEGVARIVALLGPRYGSTVCSVESSPCRGRARLTHEHGSGHRPV